MSKTSITLRVLTFMVFTLALGVMAQAQATRTWVSGVGDDVNPCSRTAPCKTYAGAISKTAAGGEISVLDPGGYGTLTATKSITVDGGTGAGWGSTLAALTTGFIINDAATATPNTITVTLRNLSINGNSNGTSGIRFLSGKNLNVENCQIFNFKGQGVNSHGIDVNLAAAAVGTHRVVVTNTIIKGSSGDGIIVRNSNAAAVLLTLVDSEIYGCTNNGVNVSTNARLLAQGNTIADNLQAGVRSNTGNIGVELDTNFIVNNGTGLLLSAGTTRIAGNRITGHATGINIAGGTIVTYGDNKVDGNTNDVVGGVIPPAIGKK